MSEEAIRNPQKRTIAVERTFKFVFNSSVSAAIKTQLVEMWFTVV